MGYSFRKMSMKGAAAHGRGGSSGREALVGGEGEVATDEDGGRRAVDGKQPLDLLAVVVRDHSGAVRRELVVVDRRSVLSERTMGTEGDAGLAAIQWRQHQLRRVVRIPAQVQDRPSVWREQGTA